MYRKPRFLEELHAIREEMSRECDYDVDLFAEMARSGQRPRYGPAHNIRGLRTRAPAGNAARKSTREHRERDMRPVYSPARSAAYFWASRVSRDTETSEQLNGRL